MIDPAEAIETYRAASAIAAFDAIQVAFAALVKKGILSKVEAEQILRQAIETIKTGGAGDQAAHLPNRKGFGYSRLTTSRQTQRRDAGGLSEAPSLG